MRHVDLSRSRPQPGQEDRAARLTRHLEARLRDFGPGGPEVLDSDQQTGRITVRFPGHKTAEVLDLLSSRFGVSAALEEEQAVFYLSPDIPFENLDYVWGCLFEVLY